MKTWFAAFVFVCIFSPLLFCESPKTHLEDLRDKTVLVFTPHPDDDAFGAGRTIALLNRNQNKVTEVSKFPSSPAFTAWLALCPNNQKSGERVLSRKTRKTKNRINHALRVAAQSLHRSQSYLGAFYRRMRARLGAPKAITATAHKLARVPYHLIKTRQPYDESVFALAEQQQQRRREQHLRRQAQSMRFTLVPTEAQPA